MANVDRVNGLRPVRHLNGSPYNGAANLYYVDGGDDTALAVGDAVKSSGTGDADGVPGVIQAAATDPIRGVVVGVLPITDESTIYREADTARYVLVADDPDIIFEVQEDSVGAALAVTDIGRNADITVAAVDTASGRSGMELDSSDIKDATAQLRLLGLVQRPDNEVGANAKWLVMINEHELKGTAGVT